MSGIVLSILITCLAIYAAVFLFLNRIIDELRTIERYLRETKKEKSE